MIMTCFCKLIYFVIDDAILSGIELTTLPFMTSVDKNILSDNASNDTLFSADVSLSNS